MGWNVLSSEIVAQLRVLINKTEKVAAEDIAVICANHEGKDHLKKVLPGMLTKKGNGTLQIVDAEEFAVKCSKVRKQVRKRKSTGKPPIQNTGSFRSPWLCSIRPKTSVQTNNPDKIDHPVNTQVSRSHDQLFRTRVEHEAAAASRAPLSGKLKRIQQEKLSHIISELQQLLVLPRAG